MAIEILDDKAKQQQIQIIFLDLTMPEMSGLEVLEWINKNNVKIPTILQTGIKDKKEIEKATILGIKDYMIKPYTKEQLYQFIVKYAKNKMILGIKNSNYEYGAQIINYGEGS